MSKLVTADQIVADAYMYANQVSGSNAFVPAAQALRLANLACGEFYDLLVACRGHEYYVKETPISLVAGTFRYFLPSDFYQLYSVTLAWGPQDVEEVPDYSSLRDRPLFLNGLAWARRGTKAFRLRQDEIEFLPVPTSAVTATLQYLPAFQDLVTGVGPGNTFNGVNGWERLISLRTAIDMCAIAQRESATLANLYAAEKQRIEEMAADRAAEHPDQIRDVCPEGPRLTRGLRRFWP